MSRYILTRKIELKYRKSFITRTTRFFEGAKFIRSLPNNAKPNSVNSTRAKNDQVDATLFAEQHLNNVVIKVQQHLLNSQC